ncbi:hypothetical protein QBC47DRAFT_332699 [Echria macrotheca]|uniref:NmrA-like domain-containing protein n=1 Tax=Echria macrotheca TaxID=438768 RepID=A0AAJ0F430_9PEZI|nr:hypothetical protein QBC47DRAFT_332699 [Echria macrotheca]
MRHRAPPAMTRIAIAGGGGFAFILAQEITSQSANPVLLISRNPHPEFETSLPEIQIAQVPSYSDIDALRYALQGIDLVISTVSNADQLNLIDAARRARVSHFVPSEFEGDLAHRPAGEDPLDRGFGAARALLERYHREGRMRYTVVSCGILMERFAPGGMGAYVNMGLSQGVVEAGAYLVDVAAGTAEVVLGMREEGAGGGGDAMVGLTSVFDVARFLGGAIEAGGLESWPREVRMRGDVMSVREVVGTCSTARRVPFRMITRTYREAQALAEEARRENDAARWFYYQRLLQTASGRYHVRGVNMAAVLGPQTAQAAGGAGAVFRPMRFRTWLEQVWGPAL